jgi:hypothetical protein
MCYAAKYIERATSDCRSAVRLRIGDLQNRMDRFFDLKQFFDIGL